MNSEEYIKQLKEASARLECDETGHDMISPQNLRCKRCNLDVNDWFDENGELK